MNETFLEKTIARYEQQFVNGRTPDLQRYLETIDSDCEVLFEELLHTDLELQIRNGNHSRVEQYLRRFPRLTDDDRLIQELICTEFKVRQQLEPGLKVEEYSARFPKKSSILRDKLVGSKFDSPLATDSHENSAQSRSYSDIEKRFRKKNLHCRGGLGNVWLAIDQELGRRVAIKEIKPRFNESPFHRSRFAREALVTSQLDHPGIVPVYGLGQSVNGAPYFAMQFIDGRTLRSAIGTLHSQETTSNSLEFNRLIQHFLDVCHTIEYAHSQNIVHRDLKPDNIMIGRFGETFVVDWGLAKASLDSSPATDQAIDVSKEIAASFRAIVREGESKSSIEGGIGSPGFMSPEQVNGDRASIGPASDIFSLGATLRSLIAGEEHPIPDQIVALAKNKFVAAPIVPVKPSQLDSICQKAMSISPNDRYQSVAEMAEDVENFLLDRPVKAHRESLGEKFGRFSRRYRMILNTALVALIAISLLSMVALFWINSERQNAIAASQAESAQREKAEDRTDQLAKTIGVFADLFSGTDKQGVGVNLNEITLQQSLDELNSQVSGQSDPIVRTFLYTVLARNNISSGNSEQAIEQYETALRLLSDNEIEETDPLHLATTVGMCSAIANGGGNPQLALPKLEHVITICNTQPNNRERILLEALLTKAQLLLTKFDNKTIPSVRATVDQANELGEKLYADDPGHIQFLRVKLLSAELLAFKDSPNQFLETYNSLIETWKSKRPLHSIIVASEIKLAEYESRFKRFEKSKEHLEAAIKDAESLYGRNHPSAISVRIRYANMLAFGNGHDDQEKARGIEILDQCRAEQLKHGAFFAALQTTRALVPALLETGEIRNNSQAIDLCEELFPHLKNCRGPAFTKIMRDLNVDLATAYQNENDIESAHLAMDEAIEFSSRLYGEDSDKTVSLMLMKRNLKAPAEIVVPSDKSKDFTRRIANLLLRGDADIAKLTETYEEFKIAWETLPVVDRPNKMAMFYITQELGKAHSIAGNQEEAIEALNESVSFAEQMFGPDARPTLELTERIESLMLHESER